MEPAILVITLACGMLVSRMSLPPLIGYLAAGFALYVLGIEESSLPLLQEFADLGVILLLFAIGLKLDLRSLAQAEVWAGSSLHMLGSLIFFVPLLSLLALLGIDQVQGLEIEQLALLAFALSFSSTVFAVKILEDKGDMQTLYGQVAIGILIMQDIFAVVFLTISKGDFPSVWALALLLLPLSKPILYRLLDKAGHGELLVLFGLVMALVLGAWLFESVGLKPDLGALIIGILLAGHKKASELAKSLFYFKELFLVAFFLTIGLNGLPSGSDVMLACILALVLPLKMLGFGALMTRFKLRSRTALLTSFSLSNYSEFGLIVTAVAASKGWLSQDWLVIIAVALSLSFLIAAPLNASAHRIYRHVHQHLTRFERQPLHPQDRSINLGNPRFLILGMGRVGSGAYDELTERFSGQILGVEHKRDLVKFHQSGGRNVAQGDASDSDFWEKLERLPELELVLLAMPHHRGNLFASQQLKRFGYKGKLSAIVQFPEDMDSLLEEGVHSVYNLYEAAGVGFVDHIAHMVPAEPEHNAQEQMR